MCGHFVQDHPWDRCVLPDCSCNRFRRELSPERIGELVQQWVGGLPVESVQVVSYDRETGVLTVSVRARLPADHIQVEIGFKELKL
jgi:hypothetical protein